ncbi:hypothetical protein B0A48_09911 [Cryoendolithus antarcticus]|uniref:Uncharacterized protein n=1 Tax=Cryoendolithus antarcticus TaxID=1507870 RepID=A0A1V8T321_9PEZI|nr:hypothetical protein B0A48_09911 [Cryoendolithus antarcticus]
MSTTTTPQRHIRGLPTVIDTTRSLFERPVSALQYGGYYTPPQSAHESRRPSLACSTYSEMPFSAASTATTFSLPPTPLHAEHVHPQMHAVYEEQSSNGLLPRLNASFDGCHQSSQSCDDLTFDHTLHAKANETDMWSMQATQASRLQTHPDYNSLQSFDHSQLGFQDLQMIGGTFDGQASGLHNTLLSASLNMLSGHAADTSAHPEPTWPFCEGGPSTNALQYDDTYQDVPTSVALAELSPQDDYATHQYSSYSSPLHEPALSSGFASSAASSFASGFTEPPSPIMDYSYDDEDYVVVKAERTTSPAPISKYGCGHGYSTDRARDRRRVSKRQRKAQNTQIRDIHGIEFKTEGDNIIFGPGGIEKLIETPNRKPHVCNFLLPNGDRCPQGFQRSEHLKRHSLSHAKKADCLLWCPVVKDDNTLCFFRSDRSDNTRDHFKTHLIPKPNGKRNERKPWVYLRDRILEEYTESAGRTPKDGERIFKAGREIVSKLQKWLETTPEDPKKWQDHEALQREHGFGAWSASSSTSRGRSKL